MIRTTSSNFQCFWRIWRGREGNNFVYTMVNKGLDGKEIRVVDDIVMSPTYTLDAAETIWSILAEKRDFGVYHTNNSGECSWFEFTKSIIKNWCGHQCCSD